jgi:hypothetical protein
MPELEVSRQLSEAVAKVIETRGAAPSISPSWVATEVLLLDGFDPTKRIKRDKRLLYELAHSAARAIARHQLARKFDPKKAKSSDPELFEKLQTRYPVVHGHDEEPRCVFRELLSDIDVAWNVSRLRAEGQAKIDHDDALEAWHAARRARGADANVPTDEADANVPTNADA